MTHREQIMAGCDRLIRDHWFVPVAPSRPGVAQLIRSENDGFWVLAEFRPAVPGGGVLITDMRWSVEPVLGAPEDRPHIAAQIDLGEFASVDLSQLHQMCERIISYLPLGAAMRPIVLAERAALSSPSVIESILARIDGLAERGHPTASRMITAGDWTRTSPPNPTRVSQIICEALAELQPELDDTLRSPALEGAAQSEGLAASLVARLTLRGYLEASEEGRTAAAGRSHPPMLH